MTQIGFKKMNWMPKQSAWNEHLQKLAKRRTMMRAFEQQSTNLINAFANISNFQITAHVDNVAKTASDRIIAEGKKQAEEMQNRLMSSMPDLGSLPKIDTVSDGDADDAAVDKTA